MRGGDRLDRHIVDQPGLAQPGGREDAARSVDRTVESSQVFGPADRDVVDVMKARGQQGLETDFRPHFFGGVAIVVAKLLNQVQADVAVFGEKDWQQLMVVRRLARDLDIPTEIVGSPTVRDGHGLALSSRNAYLGEAELAVARRLNGILAEAAVAASTGTPVATAEAEAAQALLASGFHHVDYVAIRRAEDLATFDDQTDGPARILAAAWLGKTRLIDNIAI